MTAKIVNGSYVFDKYGNMQHITGREEILQRAYFRLAAHYGQYELNKNLGSELYTINLSTISEDMLFAYILEILMPIEELDVTGVEKSVSTNPAQNIITVYLKVLNEAAILELRFPIQ